MKTAPENTATGCEDSEDGARLGSDGEAKNKGCENRPKIKLNQVQSQCRDEAEFLIVFANRSSIRNPCEDNANQRPSGKEECGSAPLNLEIPHDSGPG